MTPDLAGSVAADLDTQCRIWRIHPCLWIPEELVLGPRFRDAALDWALGEALTPVDVVYEVGLRKALVEPFDPEDPVTPGGLVLHTQAHMIGADSSISMTFLKEWRKRVTGGFTTIWIANDRRVTIEAQGGVIRLEECWGQHQRAWCEEEVFGRLLSAALASAVEFKKRLIDEAKNSAPVKVDAIEQSILL